MHRNPLNFRQLSEQYEAIVTQCLCLRWGSYPGLKKHRNHLLTIAPLCLATNRELIAEEVLERFLNLSRSFACPDAVGGLLHPVQLDPLTEPDLFESSRHTRA